LSGSSWRTGVPRNSMFSLDMRGLMDSNAACLSAVTPNRDMIRRETATSEKGCSGKPPFSANQIHLRLKNTIIWPSTYDVRNRSRG